MVNSLGKNWLPVLFFLLMLSAIIFANIRNIKRPHVATFVIECVAIWLVLVFGYGTYLTQPVQQEANMALLALEQAKSPMVVDSFSFTLDVFKLAWLEIVGIGLFYALRVTIHYGERRQE